MRFSDWLKRNLAHPLAIGLDLDSEEATEVHARLIREKAFLLKLYKRYYAEFLKADESSPAGLRLEIGSGGGFLKEMNPKIVTFDIRPGANVDLLASALTLPLKTGSVGAIFALNVLHHLPDATPFYNEVTRVLCPLGRAVFIEPYVSPLSKAIYTNLHHEPFDPDSPDWTLPRSGPMSSANGALPWITFVRDRERFDTAFPELEIQRITPHTMLLYLLSGGVSMRSLLPGLAFEPLFTVEKLLHPLMHLVASMMTVEIVRHSSE